MRVPSKLWICALGLTVIAATVLTGCGKKRAPLPTTPFISHLTGRSNIGLWKNRYQINVPHEDDVYILVDPTVPLEFIRTGQLIVFKQPGFSGLIAHPVVKVVKGGVVTHGFYNDREDDWIVNKDRYVGLVTSVSGTEHGQFTEIRY